MGLLAAVEQWVVRDHEAEWREWERRLQVIADETARFDTVTTSISQPGRSNVTPHMSIRWDAAALGVAPGGNPVAGPSLAIAADCTVVLGR